MDKPKVIHVLYSGLGGHANVVFPLLESSFGHDFNNHLVFFGIEPTVDAYIKKCESLDIDFSEIRKKPKQYIRSFGQFTETLRDLNPDTIIVHNSELIIPALQYKKKHPNCSVYYVEHQDNNTKGITLNFLSKYALKRSDGVICLSENFKDELLAKYKRKVPIHVISNGIDIDKYKTVEKRNPLVLGMASRMMQTKDHTNLLKAFKIVLQKHPEVKLEIAGDGATYNAVIALANELKVDGSVKFLGFLNDAEMIEFYNRIGIYILATNSETMSTAILQAMACGLPVITSDIKNNAAIIQHEKTGWLYKDRNSVDLANQINFVIENFDSSIKIGLTAREEIRQNYSLQKMAERYAELVKGKL